MPVVIAPNVAFDFAKTAVKYFFAIGLSAG